MSRREERLEDIGHRVARSILRERPIVGFQGLPVIHRGAPLKLAGDGHTRWREAIGNAIPPPAARAIAEQLLLALLVSKLGAWTMSNLDVWVAPPDEAAS